MPNRADARIWIAAVLALIAAPVVALDLALPQGARSTTSVTTNPDTYRLPVGVWTEATGTPVAVLDGQVVRSAWSVGGTGITTQQVLGPLQAQLESEGYKIIFTCATRACGGFDFRFGTEVLPAPDMYVDLSDFRFLAAQGPDGGSALSLLVSRNAGSIFVQLIEVGPSGATPARVESSGPALVTAEMGEIAERLETTGHVVLPGLEFASGSANLGDGSIEALEALAAYLQANPNRQVIFVGHTDAVGSLEGNIGLSRKRAEAVRAYVRNAGVPAGQVFADGVGYLSPVATNLTAEGRDANRRVEAVLISVE